jgi:site-specific DNA-methyltransferase (adenine-specific)
MRITIYNRDCLLETGMKSLKEKSISMVLCDLPFGMTKNTWDVVIPIPSMWENYNRLCNDKSVICLFGNQPFTSDLVVSNRKDFRYSLVWEKNKFSDFLNAKRKPMKIHEDILIFYKKQPIYNPQYTIGEPYVRWNKQSAVDTQTNYGKHKENHINNTDGKRLPTTVLKFNRIERPIHPTQKPVDLCEWLIKTYTNEGDMILDNCIGSGTTAISSINTLRDCVGFEKDKDYYEKCIKRIRDHINNNIYVVKEDINDDYVSWIIQVKEEEEEEEEEETD